jgi:hypothetical protein
MFFVNNGGLFRFINLFRKICLTYVGTGKR